MKLNRKLIRKMILKEMAGMMPSVPHGNLTFQKIKDIERFVSFANENGSHWMFPEGIPHKTFVELNLLYVQRINRNDLDENTSEYREALRTYAEIVTQIPGADLGSIEEILDA